MKEISQADTQWCSIEFGYVVHRKAILMSLDSFTHFILLDYREEEWYSIEVECAVCRLASLMLVDSFTHFSLLGPWAGMEGTAHPGMVCTSWANAQNVPPAPRCDNSEWYHFGRR